MGIDIFTPLMVAVSILLGYVLVIATDKRRMYFIPPLICLVLMVAVNTLFVMKCSEGTVQEYEILANADYRYKDIKESVLNPGVICYIDDTGKVEEVNTSRIVKVYAGEQVETKLVKVKYEWLFLTKVAYKLYIGT